MLLILLRILFLARVNLDCVGFSGERGDDEINELADYGWRE